MTKTPMLKHKLFLVVLIISGAIGLSTAPFWHITFPKESAKTSLQKENILKYRQERNNARDLLVSELKTHIKNYPDDNLSFLALNYINKKKKESRKRKQYPSKIQK